MLVKQHVIVLHSFPYSDNSRIVKCFSRQSGMQSYLVNGVSNKKGVLKPSMVIPLTQLEIVAYVKGKGGLERIKEARLISNYKLIPIDPYRNSMALFIAEILSKVTKEEHPNENLYQYLSNMLSRLDDPNVDIKNFHILFLADLSYHLGFKPNIGAFENAFFDMVEGTFSKSVPLHPYYMDKELSSLLVDILKQQPLKCSKESRMQLLDSLLIYYRLQFDGFGEVKSLDVIRTLF